MMMMMMMMMMKIMMMTMIMIIKNNDDDDNENNNDNDSFTVVNGQICLMNWCNNIQISAYLLGEYGHLLAQRPGCSPKELFLLLNEKIPTIS
jgi:hypothetical protein